jgi:hypothetical protein
VRVVHNPGTTVAGFNTTTYEIYGFGSKLYGVALGDLDGDQRLDIVVSSSGDNTAHVLLNDPANPGFFLEQPPIAPRLRAGRGRLHGHRRRRRPGRRLHGPHVRAGGRPRGPRARRAGGRRRRRVQPATALPVDTVGASLVSGDFNDDGWGDLVAGQPALAFQQVWVYVSIGGFDFEGTPLELPGSPGAVEVADVDNDGNVDIVVPTGEGSLRVALGDGTGAFPIIEPPGQGTWPVPLGTSYTAFADVDGDELPDLIMVSPQSPDVWIGRNLSVEIPTL